MVCHLYIYIYIHSMWIKSTDQWSYFILTGFAFISLFYTVPCWQDCSFMNRLIYYLDFSSCLCCGSSCCVAERNSGSPVNLNNVMMLNTSWQQMWMLSDCSLWLKRKLICIISEKGVLMSDVSNMVEYHITLYRDNIWPGCSYTASTSRPR